MSAREWVIRRLLDVVARLGRVYRPEFVQVMLWSAQRKIGEVTQEDR